MASAPIGPSELAVVVLSYRRFDALDATLEWLVRGGLVEASSVLVVDNGSGDGSAERVRERWSDVGLLALDENVGVEAFNLGVDQSESPVVLILDDDARPEPEALRAALRRLDGDHTLGGATLLPVHPESRVSEWPFASRAQAGERAWPVMGCANLVRRELWQALGGYDASFFLYRNDVDLALRTLGAGFGVAFDPDWIVWHDSPAAARKSERWLRTATRNWLWVARRHGRWGSGLIAGTLGGAWAMKLAGPSPARLAAACSGVVAGLRRPPRRAGESTPQGPMGGRTHRRGGGLARLMRLRLGLRATPDTVVRAAGAAPVERVDVPRRRPPVRGRSERPG